MILEVNITFRVGDKLNPHEFETIGTINKDNFKNNLVINEKLRTVGYHRISTSLEKDVYYINPDVFSMNNNRNVKLKTSIDQFIREEKINKLLQ